MLTRKKKVLLLFLSQLSACRQFSIPLPSISSDAGESASSTGGSDRDSGQDGASQNDGASEADAGQSEGGAGQGQDSGQGNAGQGGGDAVQGEDAGEGDAVQGEDAGEGDAGQDGGDSGEAPAPPVRQPLGPTFHVYPNRCVQDIECGDGETCRAGSCAASSCGNAIVDEGEQCDDGNLVDTDGCEADCMKTRVLEIRGGSKSTCALFSAGTVKCWGDNGNGRLGLGSSLANASDPSTLRPLDFGTERRVAMLTLSGTTGCVVFEDRKARCWGTNLGGLLGIGNDNDYGDEPTETLDILPDLDLPPVEEISPGGTHTCAIVRRSARLEVVCWGTGSTGALGLGRDITEVATTAPVSQPRAVSLSGRQPLRVVTFASASCVSLDNGDAVCWGNNSRNALGGAGHTFAPDMLVHPFRLPGEMPRLLSNPRASAACGFSYPATAACWGSNSDGQLGTPTLLGATVRAPVTIDLGSVEFVDFQYSGQLGCGLLESGAIRCFGRPERLGYSLSYNDEASPTANWANLPNDGRVDIGDFDGIEGIDPAVRLWVKPNGACAEVAGGDIRCWGTNQSGALGYGFTDTEGTESEVGVGAIGDNETPAEAYETLGRSAVRFW